jgi:ArsR family transcriptional regulator, virulence genes transcriptional regulator
LRQKFGGTFPRFAAYGRSFAVRLAAALLVVSDVSAFANLVNAKLSKPWYPVFAKVRRTGVGLMRSAASSARQSPGKPAKKPAAKALAIKDSATKASEALALKMLTKQAGEAAQLLKLLGNESRLLILCFLAVRGEMTVGELVDVVKLSQSALSQHLARLREDGLVTFRRDSQTLHYSVIDQKALRVLGVLKEIYCGDLM